MLVISTGFRIQLAPEKGCAIDLSSPGESTLAFSTSSHKRSPKVQLGRVLIMCTTPQVNIRLTMFPTACPGHLMMKLQKVARPTSSTLGRLVAALRSISRPNGTPNRCWDSARGLLRGSAERGRGGSGGGSTRRTRAALLFAGMLEQGVDRALDDLRYIPVRNLMPP